MPCYTELVFELPPEDVPLAPWADAGDVVHVRPGDAERYLCGRVVAEDDVQMTRPGRMLDRQYNGCWRCYGGPKPAWEK